MKEQINYEANKLTKEQFINLIGILKLSDYIKSPYNQHGRAGAHGKNSRKKKH